MISLRKVTTVSVCVSSGNLVGDSIDGKPLADGMQFVIRPGS